MPKATLWEVSLERHLIPGLMSLALLWLSGCASAQPKSSEATVTPEQVRSHADKSFDKMKQEEQRRTANPVTGP